MGQNSGDHQVGGESKMYYNNGTYDSPTWVENDNVGDLDGPDARTAVAVKIRRFWPQNRYLPGSRERGLTWTSAKAKGTVDTVLDHFLAVYDSGSPIELAIVDGDIITPGTRGKRDYYIITKADESEPIDDTVTISFEAKPAANNAGKDLAAISVT